MRATGKSQDDGKESRDKTSCRRRETSTERVGARPRRSKNRNEKKAEGGKDKQEKEDKKEEGKGTATTALLVS